MAQQRWRMRGLVVAFLTAVGLATMASQAMAQPLEPSTTSVTASPSSAAVGESVLLTATVTCPNDPSGGLGVSFFDGPDLIDTVPVDDSGQASLSTTFSTVGSHEITAAYNGNEECAASSGTTVVNVTETPEPPTPPNGGGGLINMIIGGGNVAKGGDNTGVINNGSINDTTINNR